MGFLGPKSILPLAICCILSVMSAFALSSTSTGTKADSMSSILSHISDVLSDTPSTSRTETLSSESSSEWVQGGYMSLDYYNTASCNSSSAIIYSGIDLGQCIDDLNNSGNSYFFTCSSTSIKMVTYAGPGCTSTAPNTTMIPTISASNPCYKYEYPNNPSYTPLYYGFSCSNAFPNINVPIGTLLQTVSNSANQTTSCDTNIMGYVGVSPGKCINLLDICTILGNYTQFKETCSTVTPSSDKSTKYSCTNNAPTSKTFLDNPYCINTQGIVPKIFTTGCQTPNPDQSTQVFCSLTAPPLVNGDDDASSSNADKWYSSEGAIAGLVIGAVALLVLSYFVYSKFIKNAGALGSDSKKGLLSNQV